METRIGDLEKKVGEMTAPACSRVMLNMEEAARFLGMTRDGLRRLTFKKLIPFYKPNGKNIFFDPDELIAWQKRNHFEAIVF